MGPASLHIGGAGARSLAISFPQAALATTLVVLRGLVARVHAGKLRWDFVLIVLATVFGLAVQVTQVLQCLYGVGTHIWEVPAQHIWPAIYQTWISISVGVISITLAKLSILALLLHATPYTALARRCLLWAIAIVNILVSIALIIILWLPCHLAAHVCSTAPLTINFSYFQGALASATDVFLAFYPITVVWNMQMPGRTKRIFCVFMAGSILPATASVLRIIYTSRLAKTADVTYELTKFIDWSNTEVWWVIILGSVPPLRPLFDRYLSNPSPNIPEPLNDHFPPTIGGGPGKRNMYSVDLETTMVVVETNTLQHRSVTDGVADAKDESRE